MVSVGAQLKADELRAHGEELYSLVNAWLSGLGAHYLRRNAVMQGKLTYNQCLDMDIAQGKSPFDFSRIELLIGLDFPSARDLYNKIIVERTNLIKIEAVFKRSYEEGDDEGDKLLPLYVRTQKSIENLGELLQKHILDRIRSIQS
jgi:hypothetical protein